MDRLHVEVHKPVERAVYIITTLQVGADRKRRASIASLG